MWLGKTLPFGAFGPRSCCMEYTGTAPKNLYGTRFNTGDYMVAVQWYERLTESGDGERREFIRGPRMVDVINSTELRVVAFPMNAIGVFPALAVNDDPEAHSESCHARSKPRRLRGAAKPKDPLMSALFKFSELQVAYISLQHTTRAPICICVNVSGCRCSCSEITEI